jgi:diguanylate cyclase
MVTRPSASDIKSPARLAIRLKRGLLRLFSPSEAELATLDDDSLALLVDLKEAISSGSFDLALQPKLDCASGRTECVEALIRWNRPGHGAVSPAEFIPFAERQGLIGPITLWVLQRALAVQSQLAEAGFALRIYVNLSGKLVSDTGFILKMLSDLKHKQECIGIEITETGVIENPKAAIANLQLLVDHGIPISIDDYGAGLSSLSYLKQLPANELKIDRSFVSGITTSHRDPLIVRSTIDLARALGMSVTAEGVEDEATMALLQVMGCNKLQGYLICRPVPLDVLIDHLKREAKAEMPTHRIRLPIAARRSKRIGNRN